MARQVKCLFFLYLIITSHASPLNHRKRARIEHPRTTTTTMTTTKHPVSTHLEGYPNLPAAYLPKERKATSTIFSPVGSVVPIIGNIVFHIYLDTATLRDVYEEVKQLREDLSPSRLKKVSEEIEIIETIVQGSHSIENRAIEPITSK